MKLFRAGGAIMTYLYGEKSHDSEAGGAPAPGAPLD